MPSEKKTLFPAYDMRKIGRHNASYMYDKHIVDSKMAYILYLYLNDKFDSLPNFKLVEDAINISTSETTISLGYGIDISKDMTLTYKSFLANGSIRTDIITPDSYIAFSGKRSRLINVDKWPIFDINRVRVVQNYLRRLKEIYPIAKTK